MAMEVGKFSMYMITIKCNSCAKEIPLGYEKCFHEINGIRAELNSYIQAEKLPPVPFIFSIVLDVIQFNTTNKHFCRECFFEAVKRGIEKHNILPYPREETEDSKAP